MNILNEEQIIKILKESVEEFYQKDKFLLEKDIHEQTISHRIAYYFENNLRNEKIIKEDFAIDVEYNRNLDNQKEINLNCGKCSKCDGIEIKKIRPDIILHKRGMHECNQIVIEIKKNNKCIYDEYKLKYLTHQNYKYKYKLGVWLCINKSKAKFVYYKNGETYDKIENLFL